MGVMYYVWQILHEMRQRGWLNHEFISGVVFWFGYLIKLRTRRLNKAIQNGGKGARRLNQVHVNRLSSQLHGHEARLRSLNRVSRLLSPSRIWIDFR